MKRAWQLQEAKNKFSEVVKEALSQGPQVIARKECRSRIGVPQQNLLIILLPYASPNQSALFLYQPLKQLLNETAFLRR